MPVSVPQFMRGAALVLALLAAACGEPPVKTAAVAQTDAPTSATQKTATAATTATAFAAMTPALADRSVLPPEASKDAEIVDDITPGRRGGQLVLSIAGDPKTFNPLIADDAPSREAIGMMQTGLTGYDVYNQKDKPGLAKSWEYKPETQEWVFHLREGLKWSDGEPLTADDFLFFTELVFDPSIPNDEKLAFQLEPVEGSPRYTFSAPDPLTFVAKIPGVDSFSFLNLGLLRPVPRHTLGKVWKEGQFNQAWGAGARPEELISSGPFILKEFRPGQSLIFERNPNYFRYDVKGQALPYVDRVVMVDVEDQQAMQLKFYPALETDMLETVQPENLTQLLDGEKSGKIKVYSLGAGLTINYYYFNLHQGGTYTDDKGQQQTWSPAKPGEQPPADLKNYKPFVDPDRLALFANDEFRLACSEATDRQTIINTILFGQASPLYGLISPANKEWFNPAAPQFPYNPASAKARLDKLGLIDRDGDGIREDAKGNKIRFTLVTNRENNIRERAIQQIAQSLRAVGLVAEPQVLDFNNLLTKLTQTFDFDCVLLGLTSGVPPHPSMGSNTWLSSGRMHVWYPEQKAPMTPWEAQVDQLFGSMKKTFDLEQQRQIFGQMQTLLNTHQPVIPLFSANVHMAAKTRLKNLKPTPIGPSLERGLDEVYIEE